MSEKLYSLDEIEAALRKAHHVAGEGILPARTIAKVSDMLSRPQPEFREGQVYANDDNGDYAKWRDGYQMYPGLRPLTPEEVGPGYVPVEDVRPLVETVRRIAENAYDSGAIATRIDSECLANCQIDAQESLDALPDNLKGLINDS